MMKCGHNQCTFTQCYAVQDMGQTRVTFTMLISTNIATDVNDSFSAIGPTHNIVLSAMSPLQLI